MRNSKAEDTVDLSAADASLVLGGGNTSGQIFIRQKDGTNRIVITDEGIVGGPIGAGWANYHFGISADGGMSIGGFGQVGQFYLRPANAAEALNYGVELYGDGTLRLGQYGNVGNVSIYGADGSKQIELAGATGSIYLSGQVTSINSDCAEEFDVADSEALTPGMVVVLSGEGTVCKCTKPYDKKVVGVMSGAGNYQPGILLDKSLDGENRAPISLMGKVYCKVDAQYASIEVGDLLTTSPTPGHAMKALEQDRSFGSVLGKALQSLQKGTDVIPILVALQ